MTTTRPAFTPLALVAALLLAACPADEPEPKPLHVIQQEQRRERERRLAAEKAAAQTSKGTAAAPGTSSTAGSTANEKTAAADIDESAWPEPVRQAAYRLHQAPFHTMPAAARDLAHLGMPAVPAMRQLIAFPKLPIKKRAFISFLLVELHMFRVEPLAGFLKETDMPYVQRAAVQALARVGNPEALAALDRMKTTLREAAKNPLPEPAAKPPADHNHHHHGHGHGEPPDDEPTPPGTNPYAPLIEFIETSMRQAQSWRYDDAQLLKLDRILHARNADELTTALAWIKDTTLKDGLLAVISSPVTREPVRRMVTAHFIGLFGDDLDALSTYARPGHHQWVRMSAISRLVALPSPRVDALLARMARHKSDPLAEFLSMAIAKRRQDAQTAKRKGKN